MSDYVKWTKRALTLNSTMNTVIIGIAIGFMWKSTANKGKRVSVYGNISLKDTRSAI